jgi:tetratricopeptide (TPR) repeat protein
MPVRRPRRLLLEGLLAIGLVTATVALFAPVRHYDFADYDDNIYVKQNPHLDHGLSREGLAWALRPYETNWIPLTWLSLLVDAELWGRDPGGYHATNLALHAASVLVLFLALAAATGAPLRSAFVAGVFAWHPLHVESVAWISERKDVLAGLFWMLALAAWTAYGRRPGAARYALALAALAAGLLAKALAVTLPFVLLLWDHWPLGRLQRDGRLDPARVRRALLEKLPMLPLVAAIAVVTFVVQKERGAMSSLDGIGLAIRVQNALVSYVAYLRGALWPARLAVFYPHPSEPLPAWQWLGAAALLAALTAGALAAWRRRPWLVVGGLWFLGTLVPMIGLVQVGMQSRADRYTYVPLVGLTIAAAWGVAALVETRPRLRAAAGVAAALALAALAAVTARQLPHWRDGRALFDQAVRVTEGNYVALHGLGALDLRDGEIDSAIQRLGEAARLRPRWAGARGALADALLRKGRADDAILNYQEAVRLAPRDAQLRADLGHAFAERGWHDEALAVYEAARRLDDGRDEPRMARLLARMATSWRAKGDRARASELDEQALALDPTLHAARANLALANLADGDPAEIVATLREALAAGTDAPELRAGLAEALLRQGREREAADEYRAALARRPEWVEPANNLAWLLVTAQDASVRDPQEALRWAEQATRASERKTPQVLDTLAAAQEASGRIGDAEATLDEAIALAKTAGDATLASELAARRAELERRTPLPPRDPH